MPVNAHHLPFIKLLPVEALLESTHNNSGKGVAMKAFSILEEGIHPFA